MVYVGSNMNMLRVLEAFEQNIWTQNRDSKRRTEENT
jgi:hypothetical protein